MSNENEEKKASVPLIKKKDEVKTEVKVSADSEVKKKKVVVVKKAPRPILTGSSSAPAPKDNTNFSNNSIANNGRVITKVGNLAGGNVRSNNYSRPNTGTGERRPYQGNNPGTGERRPYQGNNLGTGERRPYQGNNTGTGERRPYQGNNTGTGERRPYQGNNTGTGERRPYQGNNPGTGERRPYQGNNTGTGERRPYQGNNTGTGERRPYQGNNTGERRPYQGGSSSGFVPPVALPINEGKSSAKKTFTSKTKKDYTREQDSIEKSFSTKRKTVVMINPVPESIDIMEMITVSDLAKKMNLKVSDLIAKLMGMGMLVTMNQQIDAETAEILAAEYGCVVKVVSLYDETVIEGEKIDESQFIERPPVVTIMGHVDHGKTKTLDAIRSTNRVAGEHGGITQHIGAYSIVTDNGKKITFLDTPGHEAFTQMRARGAKVTDIVVLVVSAAEGLMAQTLEAIEHAKAASAPIIVAVNKIDLPDANIDNVKTQLSKYDLTPEDWGGSTMFVPISALRNEGIDKLLEAILLQAEVMELKASPIGRAEGSVIEARVDQGRGIAATVLIEKGQLKIGDSFVAGITFGKIRAMYNDLGEKVKVANAGDPIEITGFNEGTPDSGDPFQVTVDEKTAREVSLKRQDFKRHEGSKGLKKVNLSNIYDTIAEGGLKELKIVIKGDVHGSVEALKQTLEKLSNSEIRLVVIRAAAGAIVEQDVMLASASQAIIIGFHVRPTPKAQKVADEEKVEIRKYNLIYEAVEDISMAMEGLLSPELKEEVTGTAEIRKIFKASKIGDIAGCMITSGFITRKSHIHVIRDSVVIGDCKIAGLKRGTDDAREVKEGFECGITLDGFDNIKEGDILEAYDIKELKRTLASVKKVVKKEETEESPNP